MTTLVPEYSGTLYHQESVNSSEKSSGLSATLIKLLAPLKLYALLLFPNLSVVREAPDTTPLLSFPLSSLALP
ncbi:MAG TPA: hypothetical protein PKY28_02890 [Ferruginibacter sp.]|nr:hypothetical protein [Ferruginibacter sp.]